MLVTFFFTLAITLLISLLLLVALRRSLFNPQPKDFAQDDNCHEEIRA